MKPSQIIPALALALVLSACGGAATSNMAPAPQSAPAAEAPASAPRALEDNTASGTSGGVPAQAQQQTDRLVIKTADLSLQVESVREAEAAVRAKVQELGGYVVKSANSGSDEDMTAQIEFRVPAQRFDEALSGVQGLAKKVLGRTVSGDDVTAEFVDLESQLRNLEATRDRLLTFLDKASTVEEALKVNESLSQIQGQVEQAKGRMQYLKQSAALSTVTVRLAPVAAVAPIVEEGGWQPLIVARGALRSLVGLGQGLANVAIVLLVWTPVWLPIAVLIWWLRRRMIGRARKTAQETV